MLIAKEITSQSINGGKRNPECLNNSEHTTQHCASTGLLCLTLKNLTGYLAQAGCCAQCFPFPISFNFQNITSFHTQPYFFKVFTTLDRVTV